MGYQVIKKDNKKYAIWSTFSNSIVWDDAEKDDIIAWYVQTAIKKELEDCEEIFTALDAGEKPYPHWYSYEEALEWQEELNKTEEEEE